MTEYQKQLIKNVKDIEVEKVLHSYEGLSQYLEEHSARLDTADRIDFLYRIEDVYYFDREKDAELLKTIRHAENTFRWILYNDDYNLHLLKTEGDCFDTMVDVLCLTDYVSHLFKMYEFETSDFEDFMVELADLTAEYQDLARTKNGIAGSKVIELIEKITDICNKEDIDRKYLMELYILVMTCVVSASIQIKRHAEEGWVERPSSLRSYALRNK